MPEGIAWEICVSFDLQVSRFVVFTLEGLRLKFEVGTERAGVEIRYVNI